MKKTLVVSIFGIAVCLLMAFVLFAKKNITPAPVQRPASAWKLEKSKAWVTGRIALDSGYAKSVTLTAPTLSLSGMFHTELAYLNESDGTFTLEAEIYGPQRERLIYSGNGIPVYLEPGDTLHVEFASSDFMKNSDGKFSSVRYNGPNAAVNADLLAFAVYRKNGGYGVYRNVKTVASFKAGMDSLYSTYRDELLAFAAGRKCDPRFFDLADRQISVIKDGNTWYALDVVPNGLIPAKEAPALFAGSESSLDDRNFIYLQSYMYYLHQLAPVSIWGADTVGMTDAEKIRVIRNHFDTLLSRYPAGLSRDAMLLIALQRRYKNKEYRKALSDVFAATDRYLQSPVMREAWAEFVAPYQAAAAPKRNVYKLELRPTEQFIADLFAPYRNSGKVLYVDIWGVWCGPCRQEMPYSVELHEKLQGRPVEFVYLCTSSDKGDFDREIVKLGIADTGKNIWLNEDESRILRHYFGVSGTPHYWIIGENGDFVSESATDPSDPKTYETLRKLTEK